MIKKENRIEIFTNRMEDIVDDAAVQALDKHGFFDAPASRHYHGAYAGGLFDHSHAVAEQLVRLTEMLNLHWERPESPYIVAYFHDLCKMDQYCKIDGEFAYNQDVLIKGHGDKSAMLAAMYVRLTEEEILCIRYHMGAFGDKAEQDAYSKAVQKNENVLWTHTADMYASQVKWC